MNFIILSEKGIGPIRINFDRVVVYQKVCPDYTAIVIPGNKTTLVTETEEQIDALVRQREGRA